MSTLLSRHGKLLSFSILSTSGLLIGLRTLSSSSPTKLSPAQMDPPSPNRYPTTRYTPRSQTWPYSPSDFTRQDPSPDPDFYAASRFVTHIDDGAIAALRSYYATVLPRKGRILDLCSSWISHFPPEVEDAANRGDLYVVGLGMNKAELEKNGVLGTRTLRDLNADPSIALAQLGVTDEEEEAGKEVLDATLCVVSIDYLTAPVSVLSSVRAHTRAGGSVHLAISNRCFPTKAIARWLRVDEEERLNMVGDYLWFAGWREIEIVTVTDGKVEGEDGAGGSGGGGWLRRLLGGGDPLWVVRGKKVEGEERE